MYTFLRGYSRLLFPVTTGSGIASGFLNCDTGLSRRINPGGAREAFKGVASDKLYFRFYTVIGRWAICSALAGLKMSICPFPMAPIVLKLNCETY